MTASLGEAARFWVWRLVSGFNKARADPDTVAQLEKERAKLVEQELRRDLSEYKIHAAEHYATKEGVTQAVGRVEVSIKSLATQMESAVDRITGRTDRLLDGPTSTSARWRTEG
jgi:hypothetical protein